MNETPACCAAQENWPRMVAYSKARLDGTVDPSMVLDSVVEAAVEANRKEPIRDFEPYLFKSFVRRARLLFRRSQRVEYHDPENLTIVCVASWFVVKSRRHTVGTYTAVVLDLRNRLVLRGVPETGEQAQQPLMLLRGVDNVSLYLPSGSRTGTYDVGVFEEPGKPLVSSAGTATLEGNVTVLKAKFDISKMNSGHYLLGIRPPGVEWSYYPLVVK